MVSQVGNEGTCCQPRMSGAVNRYVDVHPKVIAGFAPPVALSNRLDDGHPGVMENLHNLKERCLIETAQIGQVGAVHPRSECSKQSSRPQHK